MHRYIFGDTETTGLGKDAGIVEISWVETDENFNEVSRHYSLINPEKPIQPGAMGAHGITEAMVADSPTISEFMEEAGYPLDVEGGVLVAHNCLTGDHEIRTPEGWVRLDQLKDGQKVMQWDSLTSRLTFTDAEVVRKSYCGPMFEWNSQYHKGVYTPNHRIYYKGKQGNEAGWRITTAQEFASKGPNSTVIPVSGVLEPESPLDISPLEARMLEMIRADGSIQKLKSHYKFVVRLKFKRKDKIARCFDLLDRLNVPYSVTVTEQEVTSFYLHTCDLVEKLANLLGASKYKMYGAWVLQLSLPSRLAILDEIQFWDGSKENSDSANKKQVLVHSSKRDDVYWLVEMAIMSGLTARATYDIPNTRGFSRDDGIIHRAVIRPRNQVKTLYKPTTVDFRGMVYCLTVPTGAFLVRRLGATWVTGNCAFDIVHFAPWMREPLTLCTLKAARVIYPEADNHKLTTLKYYLGLDGCHDRAHSADEDVNVLMQLVKRMCQDAECGLPELMHIQNIPRKIHKMSFGKHRGKALSELPKDYVNWLLTKADNIDSDLRASLLAL
jgi:DNA polymerase III epsilon subunit-like protein